ncbi:efflux transporter outer membrane subunit [Desulfovermiculus halophilus]|uniref:efflux transporter outer membrane subunit n=1 Tax=Desulfovermiculus halophilus TaxID=339722 RepID=UPI00068796B0|nr:efflux transporter outer membrane subunit [Desulfovermiculus halophilus]
MYASSRSPFFSVYLLLGFLAALSACTVFAPPERSVQPVELPADFAWDTNGTAPIDHWWRKFDSRELNSLVHAALEDNFNIRSSWAKLRQAKAVAAKSRAGLFPALDTSLEGSRSRSYRDYEMLSDTKSASLDLAASYEVDLWGRIRAGYTADRLSARAAYEDLRTTAISLTGEVVKAWVELLAARRQIQVVQDQIDVNERLLRIQVSRFEKGMASALDLTQQKELVAGSRSALPPLRARQRAALNQLALLLGRADSGSLSIRGQSLPPPIPQPEAGVPADLLMARPDVRAAFYRLRSADWAVSVARIDRLPVLSISARTALSSDSFSLAWGDWLTRLGSSLTAPVFDAGSRQAEVERSRAVSDERLAEYAGTVLEAVKEVQDALANIAGYKEQIARVEDELRAAEQAREQARIRYINGQNDYLNFVTQQRSVHELQRSLVSARADLLASQIALYRALGAGEGWDRG